MNKKQLAGFIADTSITVVEAMAMIDANAKGNLFLVDETGILRGCVTDGDIRRWILKAGDLNAPVCNIMTRTPLYLFAEESAAAEKLMQEKLITAIPILDRDRHIVDIRLLREKNTEYKKTGIDLSGVPVVIMAGGKGSRLYPFTKILPKPLIPIGDTPIVERILDRYLEYGITKYYMSINYKKNMIKAYFSDVESVYQIRYVEEKRPLGTAGSIRLIEECFDKPLFVTNCDALIMADYGDIYHYHIKAKNDITVVSALKNIIVPYGVIHSGKQGEIQSLEEKPQLSYFINTGMYVINSDMIEKIPENTVFHMTDLVEKVMKQHGRVGMYPVSEDSFLDMGEFSEMKRMEEKLNIVSE